jgi:MoaA/NifB/PqqE/SkfB family radical SAM enzyme
VKIPMDPRLFIRNARRMALLYRANPTPRAGGQLLRFLLAKAAGRAPIVTAILAVTYRCQACCPHCYASGEGRDVGGEMSTEEWRALMDALRARGALQIYFTGGEPLLREDLPDLVAHAHRIGLLNRVHTNGYLLTPELISRLKRAGLNQCGISIDDADPRVHDELRGLPGAFDRAVRALALLREQGIDRRILVYASPGSVPGGVERLVDLGKRLGVSAVHVNIPFAVGRWDGNSEAVLSVGEMGSLYALFRRHPIMSAEFTRPDTSCCGFDRTYVGITPRGEVLPCPAVPYPIGSVREEPFGTIWRRHTRAPLPQWRGSCPLNCEDGRAIFRAHAESIRSSSTTSSRKRPGSI